MSFLVPFSKQVSKLKDVGVILRDQPYLDFYRLLRLYKVFANHNVRKEATAVRMFKCYYKYEKRTRKELGASIKRERRNLRLGITLPLCPRRVSVLA